MPSTPGSTSRVFRGEFAVPFGRENDVAEVVDLFDFGVQVDVEAPPANEIVSEKEFDKMMDKECAGADEHLDGRESVVLALRTAHYFRVRRFRQRSDLAN